MSAGLETIGDRATDLLNAELNKLGNSIAEMHVARFRLKGMLEARTGLKFDAKFVTCDNDDEVELQITLQFDPEVQAALDDSFAEWEDFLERFLRS